MKLLAVQLTSPPRIVVLEETAIGSFLPMSVFGEPDPDQSNGFYDYLRSSPEDIVGLRWTPFPQAEYVLDRVPETPLLTVKTKDSVRSLLISFVGQSDFKDDISDDQWLWWNRVLVHRETGEGGWPTLFGWSVFWKLYHN